jgi:hypothetical protein
MTPGCRGPARPRVGRCGFVVAGAVACAILPAPDGVPGLPGLTQELAAQSWSSVQFQRQATSAAPLRVEVGYGAGTFRLAAADPGHLYRARLRYDEEAFTPVHRFSGDLLRIGVEGKDSSTRRVSLRGGMEEAELDLRLSREAPTDLSLEFGAVSAEIDLGGIRLQGLKVSTGASETLIRVSEPNPEPLATAGFEVGAAAFVARELGNLGAERIEVEAGVGDVRLEFQGLTRSETTLDASMGIGSLEIRVPANVGIRLTRSSFLSSLRAPDLQRQGDVWVSPNWERASVRMRISLQTALGSVTVVRLP